LLIGSGGQDNDVVRIAAKLVQVLDAPEKILDKLKQRE
jgi:hypothetical protein